MSLYLVHNNKSNPVFFPSEAECNKPTIADGTVEPGNATIASTAHYTLKCNDGYKLDEGDSETIDCNDGVLTDPLPTCVAGLYFIFHFFITFPSFIH